MEVVEERDYIPIATDYIARDLMFISQRHNVAITKTYNVSLPQTYCRHIMFHSHKRNAAITKTYNVPFLQT